MDVIAGVNVAYKMFGQFGGVSQVRFLVSSFSVWIIQHMCSLQLLLLTVCLQDRKNHKNSDQMEISGLCCQRCKMCKLLWP